MSEFNEGYEENIQEETQGEEEVQEVRLGKKKAGLFCVAILVVVLIFLYAIKGCSITKKVETPSKSSNSNIVTNQTSVNTSSNAVEVSSENTETTTVFIESSSALSEATKSGVSVETMTEESKKQKEENEGSVKEVNEPVLSEVISTSGLVSGKGVYQVGNSYMYSVGLIVVTGNDKNIPCKYFCPKNTWDALKVGDTVSVSFQTDTNGNISVNTISK